MSGDDVTISAFTTDGHGPIRIFILHADGTLSLGDGVRPDEGARALYDELARAHQLAWRTVEAEICERRGHQVDGATCRWCGAAVAPCV